MISRNNEDPAQEFPGYALYERIFDDIDGDLGRRRPTSYVSFLLPNELKEQLNREAIERELARQLEAESEEKAVQEAGQVKGKAGLAAYLPSGKRPAPTIPSVLPEQPPETVPVFDWEAATARFRALEHAPSSGDKGVVQRDLQHFAQAMANGPWRSVCPPVNWREALAQLAGDLPHFAPVVRFYERALALAELSGVPPRPAPILLLGPPGVGKTHFSQRLAEVLQTVVHRQAFDNAQSNSALRGGERYWSNTATGALWELIVLGERANPVVLLDEIDKGSREGNHKPVDALLTLLEPVTAGCVKDVSVDFEFDTRYVIYIATGNEAARISAPVRSRFVEFVIEEPDIDGRLVLAHSILRATLKDRIPNRKLRAGFKPPGNLQICALAWLTPRQIRMTCEAALGAAALAGRHHFEDADFEEALPKQTEASATPRRKPPKGDGDDIAVFVVRT